MSFLHKAITMHFPLEGVGVFVFVRSLRALPTADQEEGFQSSPFFCGSQILWQDLRVAESERDQDVTLG